MRAFAVGFKDMVEIRIAESPPTEHTSQVRRKLEASKPPPAWDPYFDGVWKVPKYFILKTTIHKGGRVVNVVSSRSFKYKTGVTAPRHGKMVEFDYTLVEKFRKGGDGN